jgi:hypothetical protein
MINKGVNRRQPYYAACCYKVQYDGAIAPYNSNPCKAEPVHRVPPFGMRRLADRLTASALHLLVHQPHHPIHYAIQPAINIQRIDPRGDLFKRFQFLQAQEDRIAFHYLRGIVQ